MVENVTPYLMFEGQAEAALNHYVRLIPGAVVTRLAHYGSDGPGREGEVSHARIVIAGREIICMDSHVHHDFSFTPSFSMFMDCSDPVEIEQLFAGLSDQGKVLMPLASYGVSELFGWVNDRFGVSWQLNLASI
jgi:predicted 3-demethylubiquinone-9 3-methyltransferase (glyoxalase superfamily)